MVTENVFRHIQDLLQKATVNFHLWKSLHQSLQQIVKDDKSDELIIYKDGNILKQLYNALNNTKSGQGDSIDEILECITILSETDKGCEVGWPFIQDILDLYLRKNLSVATLLEISKHLNALLTGLPKADLVQLRKAQVVGRFLEAFGELFIEAGDYDLQATLVEAILRILDSSEKVRFANQWLSQDHLRKVFLAIQNQDFENGCRNFINKANESRDEDRSVYSIPCNGFYLGMYKLHAPEGQASKDVWVDFNTGSKSITAFVRDDASKELGDSTWETIAIRVDFVRDLRINDSGRELVLILKLTIPACELVPFCPKAQEHYAKISFAKDQKIATAVSSLFGEVRYVELPYSSPSISSTPTKASTARLPYRISSRIESGSSESNRTLPKPVEASKAVKTTRKSALPVNDTVKKADVPESLPDCPKLCPSKVEEKQQQDSAEVIPETQDVEPKQKEKLEKSGKTVVKKEVKKTKIAIQPRKLIPRKAKSNAVSPFSFKEAGSDGFSNLPAAKPKGKITEDCRVEINAEQEEIDDNDGRLLDSETESINNLIQKKEHPSFTDPRKVKKKAATRTFMKRKQSKDEKLKPKYAPKNYARSNRREDKKEGKMQFSDSESDEGARELEERKTKLKYPKANRRKPKKKQTKSEISKKTKDVSIADLVMLYDRRHSPMSDDEKMNKEHKCSHAKDSEDCDNEEISKDFVSDAEEATVYVAEEKKARLIPNKELNDPDKTPTHMAEEKKLDAWELKTRKEFDFEIEDEASSNDGDLTSEESEHREFIKPKVLKGKQTRNGQRTKRSVIVTDEEDVALMEPKKTYDAKSNLNDEESDDIYQHTTEEKCTNPVESFAKICQSILDASSRGVTRQLSAEEIETPKSICDSSNRGAAVQQSSPEDFETPKVTKKLTLKREMKKNREKSDEVVKRKRNTASKKQKLSKDANEDEGLKPSLKSGKYRRMNRKRSVADIESDEEEMECFNTEMTPCGDVEKPPPASRSNYDVTSLLEKLRSKVGSTMKKRESELLKFTDAAAEVVREKLTTVWAEQRSERERLIEDIDCKLKYELRSMKTELQLQKERQDKFLDLLLKHQQENVHSTKIQTQRLEKLEYVNSTLKKGMWSLEEKHNKCDAFAEAQIRKEIGKMQEKLIRESKKQELYNVRRQLNKTLSHM